MRLALLVFGVAAGLGIMELALRVLGPSPAVGDLRGLHELRLDRPWLYGLRPGADGVMRETGDVHYHINVDGFRGPRHMRPKPPRSFRIAVLGDSVAFGYGVEEPQAFPRLMEKRLGEIVTERPVEVVNLAVGGYNPYNELELLKDLGATYEPDLVLVQFCINDLNDPTLHFDQQPRIHLAAIPDAAFPDPSVRRAPARPPSALLRACRRSRVCARLDEALLALRAGEVPHAEEVVALKPIERSSGPEWEWLEARYAEIAAESERLGADFAVLAMPFPGQLVESVAHPIQERLLAIGRRRSWTVVDPLPAFRQAWKARKSEKLFLDFFHPTPAGHLLTARAILAQLACADLLPAQARGLCLRLPDAAAMRK
jgi:lysophospholipase L1-like esterase